MIPPVSFDADCSNDDCPKRSIDFFGDAPNFELFFDFMPFPSKLELEEFSLFLSKFFEPLPPFRGDIDFLSYVSSSSEFKLPKESKSLF